MFTIKYHSDGTIERYKAHLVAKGYTQMYGIDYLETFAPVAKITSARVLLSLAATFDWPLHQFDVKNAFLNGDLHEEVYMSLPLGVYGKEMQGKVCKLQKSIYGLKQSPRAWFERFWAALVSFGYIQTQSDHTLFLKRNNTLVTFLIVYVDDFVVTGNDTREVSKLKRFFNSEFEIKDLGDLRYF